MTSLEVSAAVQRTVLRTRIRSSNVTVPLEVSSCRVVASTINERRRYLWRRCCRRCRGCRLRLVLRALERLHVDNLAAENEPENISFVQLRFEKKKKRRSQITNLVRKLILSKVAKKFDGSSQEIKFHSSRRKFQVHFNSLN